MFDYLIDAYLYFLNKRYCSKCKTYTPHNESNIGNMEIEECLICGNKRITDIDLLKNNLERIKLKVIEGK